MWKRVAGGKYTSVPGPQLLKKNSSYRESLDGLQLLFLILWLLPLGCLLGPSLGWTPMEHVHGAQESFPIISSNRLEVSQTNSRLNWEP